MGKVTKKRKTYLQWRQKRAALFELTKHMIQQTARIFSLRSASIIKKNTLLIQPLTLSCQSGGYTEGAQATPPPVQLKHFICQLRNRKTRTAATVRARQKNTVFMVRQPGVSPYVHDSSRVIRFFSSFPIFTLMGTLHVFTREISNTAVFPKVYFYLDRRTSAAPRHNSSRTRKMIV